ncbi:hypothetical protein YC2023_053761 [Brassica napus]
MAKSSFQLSNPLETRMNEATRIREKYPDRVPNIIRIITIRPEIKTFNNYTTVYKLDYSTFP